MPGLGLGSEVDGWAVAPAGEREAFGGGEALGDGADDLASDEADEDGEEELDFEPHHSDGDASAQQHQPGGPEHAGTQRPEQAALIGLFTGADQEGAEHRRDNPDRGDQHGQDEQVVLPAHDVGGEERGRAGGEGHGGDD